MLICGLASRTAASGPPASAMFALPGRREAPLRSFEPPPSPSRRPFRALVPDADLPHAWRRIRAEMRRAVSDSTWHLWLEPLEAHAARGRHAGGRGAGREPRLGRASASRALLQRVHRGGARAPARACSSSRAGAAAPTPPSRRAPRRRRRRLQPALHVRPVRDRRRQPARPRRRAGGRRDARARLQPAVHLRAARARQDPPAALDRQLRPRARRRAHRALHDGRGVHRPLRRRAPHAARSTRSRRPIAASTSCSSTTSSSSRARSAPSRSSSTPSTRCTAPARSSCSRPTARRATSTRSRTACASASRPAWSPRSRPPDLAHPPHDPAQARAAGRRRGRRPERARPDRRARRRATSARSRAR